MKKSLSFVVLTLTILALVACAPAAPTAAPTTAAPVGDGAKTLTIASGAKGGVWNPLGTALQKMLMQYQPGSEVVVKESSGGPENLKLLVSNQADLVFAYDYHVVRLNQGQLPAVADGKKDVRILMGLYEQPLQIVARSDSGIASLADLKGKRVSTSAAGSGVEEQAGYVLKALGLDWDKDIQRQSLNAADSAAALKDGKLDAFFWSGAVPTASITDLAKSNDGKIVLIPVDAATAETIMQKTPGVFHRTTIPAQAYPGLSQAVDTLAISAVLCVRADMPDDQARQILETVFNHHAELASAWAAAADLTPEKSIAVPGADALPFLHPAAAAFFPKR
jgi:uncharacterized protein